MHKNVFFTEFLEMEMVAKATKNGLNDISCILTPGLW